VINRSTTRDTPLRPMARYEVAGLFGTHAAETILASVHVRAHQQAGHMDASDLVKTPRDTLQGEGRPHMSVEPPYAPLYGGSRGHDVSRPGHGKRDDRGSVCRTCHPYTEARLSAIPVADPTVQRRRIVLERRDPECIVATARVRVPHAVPSQDRPALREGSRPAFVRREPPDCLSYSGR
jgi:hypothetical protein